MASTSTPVDSSNRASADGSPAEAPSPTQPGSPSLPMPANSLSSVSAEVSPAKSPCPRPPGLWCCNSSPTVKANSFAGAQTVSHPVDKYTGRSVGQLSRQKLHATTPGDLAAGPASSQRGGDDSSGKSHMVCRHWKTKGWCKYQTNCKFMHPEHKRGVTPVCPGATAVRAGFHEDTSLN